MSNGLRIRFAAPKDAGLVLGFIRSLAEFEGRPDCVTATEELIHENLFVKKVAEALIAELDNEPVGLAVFYHRFCGFLGKSNLYVEDFFIKENHRRKGIGKQIFSFIVDLAKERNCERIEWCTLHWNANAISFYKSRGAKLVDDLKVFRLVLSEFQNCE